MYKSQLIAGFYDSGDPGTKNPVARSDLSSIVYPEPVHINKTPARIGIFTPAGYLPKDRRGFRSCLSSGAINTFDFNSIAKQDAGIESSVAVSLSNKSSKPGFIKVNEGSANFT